MGLPCNEEECNDRGQKKFTFILSVLLTHDIINIKDLALLSLLALKVENV